MPTFSVDGVSVVGFDGFRAHNSLFPYSTGVVSWISAETRAPDQQGRDPLPHGQAHPARLLKRVIKQRIAEINDSYPKSPVSTGVLRQRRIEVLRPLPRRRHDGAWKFYRRDGSLMRSGSFRAGKKLDDWVTYARGSAGGECGRRPVSARSGWDGRSAGTAAEGRHPPASIGRCRCWVARGRVLAVGYFDPAATHPTAGCCAFSPRGGRDAARLLTRGGWAAGGGQPRRWGGSPSGPRRRRGPPSSSIRTARYRCPAYGASSSSISSSVPPKRPVNA